MTGEIDGSVRLTSRREEAQSAAALVGATRHRPLAECGVPRDSIVRGDEGPGCVLTKQYREGLGVGMCGKGERAFPITDQLGTLEGSTEGVGVGASTSKNASPIYRDSNNAMNHPRDSNDVMNHPSMEKVTSLYDAPLSTNDNNHNGFTGDKRSDDKLENARSYLSVAKSGMVNKPHFIHQTSLISLK